MHRTAEGNSIVATRDFIKIVFTLINKGYSIHELNPQALKATFRAQNGLFDLRLEEESIPVFVLAGDNINPHHHNDKTTTLAITGADNVIAQSLSVLFQTKPPMGADILSAFVYVVLTEVAPVHVLFSQAQKLTPVSGLEVVKEKQGTKVTLRNREQSPRTLIFKDPTSFTGSDIHYSTTRYCTSPHEILAWVLA